MPIRQVPRAAELRYFLICYSAEGVERRGDADAPDGFLSSRVFECLANTAVTDVFVMSHGWRGDVPAAIGQYDRWIGAVAGCQIDRARIRKKRPEFQPLLIGLHWPSQPWGDERLEGGGVSFSSIDSSPLDQLVDQYADRIANTHAAHAALKLIFEAALDDIAPDHLSAEVRDAYLVLDRESGLSAQSDDVTPGADREQFDPERAYQNEMAEAADFGGISLDGILAPLRQLSFWKMKDRARRFGESGAHQLLKSLQDTATTSGRVVRFHLMGHSFGCIVMSATLAGVQGQGVLASPVNSLFLVQGALSLWSYCNSVPYGPHRAGYFYSIISTDKVRGPIVATFSEHDTAVGRYYPLGAGVRWQISYAPGELPKYGGLGTFGIRGPGLEIKDCNMLDCNGQYDFEPGKVYNLDASAYICRMIDSGGAHNDIAHPEVAHAFWEAVT
jgi:hypothetical protein